MLLAQAYPGSSVVGSDYHAASIDLARKRAADAGVADRTSFEVASAQTFSGSGYDLVTTFDCLHDMGDPVCCRPAHPGGHRAGRQLAWSSSPMPAPRWPTICNPLGRLSYSFSTFLCVPSGLSQPGVTTRRPSRGGRIRQVTADAGFTRFRRAAETPFNLIYEVRP